MDVLLCRNNKFVTEILCDVKPILKKIPNHFPLFLDKLYTDNMIKSYFREEELLCVYLKMFAEKDSASTKNMPK